MKAVLAASLAALLADAAPAWAERGALSQRPGADGCIREDGGEECTDADLLFGSFSVAVTGDGHHAYVALADGRGVAALVRKQGTGALTQLPAPSGCVSQTGTGGLCATGRGLYAPVSVVVSPDGKHVYVASNQRDPVSKSSVALLARDARTGALTQLPGAQGCFSEDIGGGECTPAVGLRGATSIAASRDGRSVYVAASDAVAVFARDARTGSLTQLPGTQGCISQSGNGGQCTQGKALDGAAGVTLSKDGRFVYVAAEHSRAVAVFARDRATGALTQLPGEDGCISEDGDDEQCTDGVGLGGPGSVAVSPTGRSVYVVSPVSHQLAVLRRDRKTGTLHHLQCLEDDGSMVCDAAVELRQPYAVTVSPDAKHVYVAARDDDAVGVFAHDRNTGTLTQLAAQEGCISDDGSEGDCTDGRALRDPRSVTVSRNGKHVYVATQGSAAVAVLQRE